MSITKKTGLNYVSGNDGYSLWERNKGHKYILLYIQHPLQAYLKVSNILL